MFSHVDSAKSPIMAALRRLSVCHQQMFQTMSCATTPSVVFHWQQQQTILIDWLIFYFFAQSRWDIQLRAISSLLICCFSFILIWLFDPSCDFRKEFRPSYTDDRYFFKATLTLKSWWMRWPCIWVTEPMRSRTESPKLFVIAFFINYFLYWNKPETFQHSYRRAGIS